MLNFKKHSLTALVLAAALAIVILATQPGSAQQAAGPFTAAQAAAGRAARGFGGVSHRNRVFCIRPVFPLIYQWKQRARS